MMRKILLLAAGLALASAATAQAAEKYTFDPSHSQILFSYNHLGFSTTYGMFSGFDGTIMLDEADPSKSTVSTAFKAGDMMTGWDKRMTHFMSPDFFKEGKDSPVSFESTKVEVTGEKTAKITGNLTLNGVTKPVVLDARLNKMGKHPTAGKPWAGFEATTMLKRSDFGLEKFAPYIGDEVELQISVEAMQAG